MQYNSTPVGMFYVPEFVNNIHYWLLLLFYYYTLSYFYLTSFFYIVIVGSLFRIIIAVNQADRKVQINKAVKNF